MSPTTSLLSPPGSTPFNTPSTLSVLPERPTSCSSLGAAGHQPKPSQLKLDPLSSRSQIPSVEPASSSSTVCRFLNMTLCIRISRCSIVHKYLDSDNSGTHADCVTVCYTPFCSIFGRCSPLCIGQRPSPPNSRRLLEAKRQPSGHPQ